ncbi:MAG: DUF6169 family protein [Emticicia sp.]|uniref:DUF6169 family protein n=1 Tax=Emticicia sp. TaxID=1930953 RepID=UPI003BA53331
MQNLSSYDFIFVGGTENSYVFETEIGVIYEIKFKPSKYIFESGFSYSDFTFEFVIKILENPVHKSPPLDLRVSATTAEIFIDFFKNEQNIIVYTCETNDAKEYARFRKFNQWFKSFNDGTFKKEDFKLKDKLTNIIYYSSIIIKNNNPNKHEILAEFAEVMEQYLK